MQKDQVPKFVLLRSVLTFVTLFRKGKSSSKKIFVRKFECITRK